LEKHTKNDISTAQSLIAGIDIGGTKIALALAAPDCRVLSKCSFPTRVADGAHKILERTLNELEKLIEQAGASLTAIGVACAGPLDLKRGMTLSPPNLPGWENFPIVEIISRRFNIPVVFDNDANAAALAEHKFGAGRGFNNFVYMTISTGIGGGIIIDGKLVHGISGNAGEVGHILVMPNGYKCGCGARGCLEAVCSGTGIARRMRMKIFNGKESSVTAKVEDAEQITAKLIAEAAATGDPVAREIWEETIAYLSLGLSNVIVMLEPEAIILGGGVALTGEQLLKPLRELVYSRVKILSASNVQILQAGLKAESGVYGALALAAAAQGELSKTTKTGAFNF
jgi:glucokinase